MPLFNRRSKSKSIIGLQLTSEGVICPSGYHQLVDAPEVAAAIWHIADLIASMTIHLMQNRDNGDVRIKDALSRKVDIVPWSLGTRRTLIQWLVQSMFLAGESCILPVTENGLIKDLSPMPNARAQLKADGTPYEVVWRGVPFSPDEVLHFVLRPDPDKPWRGLAPSVQLQPIVDSIMQTAETKLAYMSSEYKPPIIVAVNADSDLADEASRERFVKKYMTRRNKSEPLIIPSDLMSVQQVKPLTLNDLAIKDGIELDKAYVASLIGVPPYVVGSGPFNKDEHNAFISTKLLGVAQTIEQELTKKILLAEDRYFRFNARSLYAYDLKELADIGNEEYVRGLMTGNEVRDWLTLPPKDGLDELVMLENYIPANKIGDQKKLIQEE